ncbi:PEP-CTERM sorting domain-containing protein [Anabaena sp. CCY 9402-a]|uniref:PEP-CTERM sorting domain-containing protein n=1 Tax=Anabaena sp. CCY 9402-a TaxID=3103867 RepID=UPI0039C5B6D8
MLNSIKNSILSASVLSITTLAVVSPSYAANLDLSTWESIGDVSLTSGQATLNSGTLNTAITGGSVGSVEDFLSIPGGSLDPVGSFFGATAGSAIKTTFAGVKAGAVFNFDWSFSSSDSDSAFVTFNDLVVPLTGGSNFSYVFATAGNYHVGISVVDVDDTIGESQLIVRNANFTQVPEPATTLGAIAAFGLSISIKRRFQNKARA